jgi:hypothetical protein
VRFVDEVLFDHGVNLVDVKGTLVEDKAQVGFGQCLCNWKTYFDPLFCSLEHD